MVSVDEQRKKGGNPDICSVHQYNAYFFEPDDKRLAQLYSDCRSGKMLCGECKALLFEKVWKFLEEHQARREKAKDTIEDFFVRD
jgi:tryptophanyl-tRNA synthetase